MSFAEVPPAKLAEPPLSMADFLAVMHQTNSSVSAVSGPNPMIHVCVPAHGVRTEVVKGKGRRRCGVCVSAQSDLLPFEKWTEQ